MTNLFKLIVGVIGVGVIVKFTPILDILYLFFMIVCVPLMLLLSIGIITSATFNAFVGPGNEFFAQMRERVDHHRDSQNLSGGGREVNA